MKLAVFTGRAAGGLTEDFIESGGGLEAGHESAVRDGVALICQQINRILDTYP